MFQAERTLTNRQVVPEVGVNAGGTGLWKWLCQGGMGGP